MLALTLKLLGYSEEEIESTLSFSKKSGVNIEKSFTDFTKCEPAAAAIITSVNRRSRMRDNDYANNERPTGLRFEHLKDLEDL